MPFNPRYSTSPQSYITHHMLLIPHTSLAMIFNIPRTVIFGIVLLSTISQSLARPRFSPKEYNKWFFGDGTYYGWTDGGNCALRDRPRAYISMKAVAINTNQYANSASCGACVEYIGLGPGSGGKPITGKHIAYVHDRCPASECRRGSLDLSESGDGRWKIKFRFVKCPFRNRLSFLFEGSHQYYWKIQPRGLRVPARKVTINGRMAKRSQDNFFELNEKVRTPATVVVVDIQGRRFVRKIGRVVNGIDFLGYK